MRLASGLIAWAVVLAALPACEKARPKAMIQPAAGTMHGITLTVTDNGKGGLHLIVQNNRPERITMPEGKTTLLFIDGLPTFELGPSELYVPSHAGLHVRAPRDEGSLGPGEKWATDIDLEEGVEAADHKLTRAELPSRAVPMRGEWFTTMFVRVWAFPQVDLPGGEFPWLPYLVLEEPPHPDDSPDFWFPRQGRIRCLVIGDAYGAFEESVHGVDPQLSLYFAEVEVQLTAPWLVSLLEEP